MAESTLIDLTLFVLTSKTTFCLGPFCEFERKIYTVTFISTYFYSLFQTASFLKMLERPLILMVREPAW